ncbi:MAG: glycosyltransferase family 2 protein [Clostridia bacterium]|nr:glycosyltransferase family 2 protein [Clostridia bacterium]
MNFVSLENKGKEIFAKFPKTRRLFKGIYQRTMYLISHENITSEGNILRVSPDDAEYFFGYYDKSPWDVTDRYMIALKVKNAYKVPDSTEKAEIVAFDTQNGNKAITIGTTHCWNSQQGCMAQWLAPDFKSKIIYNDFRDNHYVSVIYDFENKREEKVFDMPIYDVAKNGEFALTLDFSRLHRLRKGYGYANLQETTKKELCPDKPCIWRIDLKSGEITEVIKYTDLSTFEIRDNMNGAEHKVNHIMINPSGTRFMVLHRWFKNNQKFTRLVTMNIDGSDKYNLSDDDFVSHCCWKNDNEILSFLRKKETKDHYYLMKDKTKEYQMFWEELNTDGHCTYSPDGRFVITDTYPNRKRIASVFLCKENEHSVRIARVFSPFKYDNDTRCDLHPRWNHQEDKICIDSVHEGKKELYVLDIKEIISEKKMNNNILVSVVIPFYNALETIDRTLKSVERQKHKNIEVILIDDGSKDNLPEFLEKNHYHERLNIKYIRKENGGVSSARNLGIANANGKYICFLDADDIYHENFISKCLYEIEKTGCDTIITHQDRNLEKVEKGLFDVLLNNQVIAREDLMEYFMYNKENIHFGGIFYKKDIIDATKLHFELNTKYGEDLEFAWKFLSNCTRGGMILKDKMYGYYNNPNSAINTIRWEKTDLIKAMNRTKEYLEAKNDEFTEKFENYMLPRTYWTVSKTFAVGGRKDYYQKFIKEYPVKENIKKLVKSSKNKLLKYSSALFGISTALFYIAVKIVYKKR